MEKTEADGLNYIVRYPHWINSTVDSLNIGLKITASRVPFEVARQFCRRIPGYDLAMAKTDENFQVMMAYYLRALAFGESKRGDQYDTLVCNTLDPHIR